MKELNELIEKYENCIALYIEQHDVEKMEKSNLFSKEFIENLKYELDNYNEIYEGNIADEPFTLISIDTYNFKTVEQLQFCLDNFSDNL